MDIWTYIHSRISLFFFFCPLDEVGYILSFATCSWSLILFYHISWFPSCEWSLLGSIKTGNLLISCSSQELWLTSIFHATYLCRLNSINLSQFCWLLVVLTCVNKKRLICFSVLLIYLNSIDSWFLMVLLTCVKKRSHWFKSCRTVVNISIYLAAWHHCLGHPNSVKPSNF